MRHYIDFAWYETPRMRWRVDGVSMYLLSFVVVYVVLAICLALFGLVIAAIYHKPIWRPHTWTDFIIPLLLPLPISLFRFWPGMIRIKDGRLIYSSGMDRERGWQLKRCRVVSCAQVRGVLKLQVEVPRSNWNSTETMRVQILARPNCAHKIQAAFETGGATFAPRAEISAYA